MPGRRKKKNLRSSQHAAKIKKKAAGSARKPRSTTKKSAARRKETTHGAKESVLPVHDLSGKSVDTIQLDPLFHAEPLNTDVIYQAVLMYRAGQREGTASTKERGQVRGGGKKPWRQKGTGQARHGSRRSPIWRGGGTTFGPSPRDYSYALPDQLKKRAVTEGLKQKVANKKLLFMSRLEVDAPKTKLVAKILDTFKLEKPLFVVDQKNENLLLASRNISGVAVKTAGEVNAFDVVSHNECLITKAAYTGLLKRLKS